LQSLDVDSRGRGVTKIEDFLDLLVVSGVIFNFEKLIPAILDADGAIRVSFCVDTSCDIVIGVRVNITIEEEDRS